MYTEKIQKLEKEILEIKKAIKASKKEIKKREKILSMIIDNKMVADEEVEVEIEIYKEENQKYTNKLKTRKELIQNYKKL